ncbi:hypothetical protein KPP03845_100363 [Streptomyces xanthophaeus]|uniref:hypothetical protein n=1 Tax=Streptomyces xanthophaeus TaxID=67385 RepID=UPI00233F26BC|nr:hypothetical protein [Streptomyces xanthophaeus]WCD84043.1 hypothetical protein KPP03845_100363 [Streptomyces xanthophaeus]
MAGHHRYHLDQDGHSITVLCDVGRLHAQVLVDGKVVSSARMGRSGATLLYGEVPTDPPQPFEIRLDHPYDSRDIPPCVMETDGRRYLMPTAPLSPQEAWPAERTPSARTPGQLVARWSARYRAHRLPVVRRSKDS